MSLGERCDEIVRLIDETLADLGLPLAVPPAAAPATVTPLTGTRAGLLRRERAAEAERVDRAAAGF